MTTNAPDVALPDVEDGKEQPKTWDTIAADFARKMAQETFPRGDLAELRRMDPKRTDSPALLRLMADHGLLGLPRVERKWALILHGIALMTQTAGTDASARSAHNGQMPVGMALYLGDQEARQRAFYSESRLKRLLTSRGGMTRTLLARTFRMLAAAKVKFNWREMARFIFNDGFNEYAAEQDRRRIASHYFQAQYRSQPDTTGNE